MTNLKNKLNKQRNIKQLHVIGMDKVNENIKAYEVH